ncbi:hypothetical protein W911_02225 [Hyphomicrobium nitrativorans NL23]|uniref:Uncharacterized protein n=1 Tax=Hyphomicrobium nitrativorans NL23 TaxID=1029756 RepID=V5SH48_9HYPH|nr:hypothetical protein [Hyphomicrobium nitrativorans]AHB49848.1 hypothetical protein W911_02225 [Hyphomicrobium nitrativorans NL23]
MPLRPSARANGPVKDEKEARLKAFVARHLEALREQGAPAGNVTYRLLALSAESPVACALEALTADLEAAGVALEIVFVRHTKLEPAAAMTRADCRFATDIRLLDAHEQLVLDDTTAWIGDCMRRDPLKRDAYELFCDRCTTTSGNAQRSFAHIWNAAGPKGSLSAAPAPRGPRPPNLFDPSLLAGNDAAPPPALLRH